MSGTTSPDVIARAITHLASVCDGAHAEDGVGFNGGDTAFGRSLAAQIESGRPMTANQARAAAHMLKKYAGQLAAVGIDTTDIAAAGRAAETEAAARPAPSRTVHATVEGGLIYVRSPFAFKDRVKALAGARWHPTSKSWTLPASETAAASLAAACKRGQFHLAADPAILGLVDAADQQAAEQRRALLAADDELAPIPGRTDAWTHQRRGYAFAAPRSGAMLAMDMGTGKSRTAIGLVEGWDGHDAPHARRVLILCPVSVMRVWPREFRIHAERDWNVTVLAGTAAKKAKALRAFAATPADHPAALVVNYESAWRDPIATALLATRWDVVICDESHRIKSPGGKASQFASRLTATAKRRLALTGTPMPHSPLDVYAQARFLDPGIFGTSFFRFRARYAVMGGFEGRQVIGYQNEDEFTRRLAEFAFQCKAEDVLDLPETVDVIRTCDLEPAARKAYNALAEEFVADVEGGQITAANGGVKVLRLQQITGGVAPVDDPDNPPHHPVIVSTAKRDLLADVIADLPAGDPVVVFARFTHDLRQIREVAEAAGRDYAEISGNRKDALDDDARIPEGFGGIIGVQIQSGGVGIDLTRAAVAIYYSVGHNLGDYLQSVKRIHRPGQTRNTLYIYLVARGTVDVSIAAALRNRQEGIDALMAQARASVLPADDEADA